MTSLLLVLIIFAVNLFTPTNAFADDTSNVKVTSASVTAHTDGTAPFDGDNEAGDDSSETNDIVRSFDYINYTIGYTTELIDASRTQTDSVRIRMTATLPVSPKVAQFDTSNGMTWAEDAHIEYIGDGYDSTDTWDKGTAISRQILTCYRTVQADEVPGTGQLTLTVHVMDAMNGMSIMPFISLEVDGTTAVGISDVPKIKVSSAESSLDVYYVQGSTSKSQNPVYVNENDYTTNAWSLNDTDPSVRDEKGTVYATNVAILMHGRGSEEKGIKGMRVPTGTVTFDIKSTLTLDGEDVTHGDGYHYTMWDATAFNGGPWSWAVAEIAPWKYGRRLDIVDNDGEGHTPVNRMENDKADEGAHPYFVDYHGGVWTFDVDDTDSSIIHVTVSDFDIDWDNLTFPVAYYASAGPNDRIYGSDEFYIASGIIQHLVTYPRDAGGSHVLNFETHVETSTVSGHRNDGWLQSTVTDYLGNVPKPWWRMRHFGTDISLSADGTMGSTLQWNNVAQGETAFGDGSAANDTKTYPTFFQYVDYTGSGAKAIDALAKFDTDAFEVIDLDGGDEKGMMWPSNSTRGKNTGTPSEDTLLNHTTIRTTGTAQRIDNFGKNGESVMSQVWYATKPDGTGWASQQEQNEAHITDLVYYPTYEALQASGKTCVGLLREIRDTDMLAFSGLTVFDTVPLKTKSDVTPGQVGTMTLEANLWTDTGTPGSVGDHQNDDGSYGRIHDGNVAENGSVYDGYSSQPGYQQHYSTYTPTEYTDGVITGGNTGGQSYGESLLFIGDSATVSINGTDETSDGKTKTTYDMDADERVLHVAVTPSTKALTESNTTSGNGLKDNLTLTVTLPKGLSLIQGGASRTIESRTDNDDGTTTLTFKYDGITIGDTLDPTYLSLFIGNPGSDDDVTNNQQLTIKAHVISDNDTSESSDHDASMSINIVKLSTLSVSLMVSSVRANTPDEYTWTLRVSNMSDADMEDVRLVDALPYDGTGVPQTQGAHPMLRSVTLDTTGATKTAQQLPSGVVTLLYGTARQSVLDAGYVTNGDIATALSMDDGSFQRLDFTDGEATVTDPTSHEWNTNNTLYIALGTLCAHEHVDIKLNMKADNAHGRVGRWQYTNQFVEASSSQSADVSSNTVTHSVYEIERTIVKHCDWKSGPSYPDKATFALRGDKIDATMTTTLTSGYGVVQEGGLPAFDSDGNLLDYASVTLTETDLPDFCDEPTIELQPATSAQSADGIRFQYVWVVANDLKRYELPSAGDTSNNWVLIVSGILVSILSIGRIGRTHEEFTNRK